MKNFIVLLSLTMFLFSSCKNGLSDKEKQNFTQKGKEIAQVTFKKLGGEVKAKMKEGGVAKAVPYCNAHANNLTEEIANKFNVSIKRTSEKLRNTDNKPTTEEQAFLESFKELLAQGSKPKPVVEKDQNGKPHFYAPIIVKKKCLACHGVLEETLKKESDSIIKHLYPKDKATGYKEGDLRGIWSIAFDEK